MSIVILRITPEIVVAEGIIQMVYSTIFFSLHGFGSLISIRRHCEMLTADFVWK